MSERTCKECGTDIGHMHHFSKFCDEHKPAKPARKVQSAAKEGSVSRESVQTAVKAVKAVKDDVTPEQRAAFKEAQAPVENIAEQRIREIREDRTHTRVNIGGPDLKMAAELPPGMKGYWSNDDKGKLQHRMNRGYVHVTEDVPGVVANNTGNGSIIEMNVGTKEGGGAQTSYLLMIPEEIYEEDQATKRLKLDKIDEAINRGETLNPEEGHDDSHRYSRINIERD